MAGVWSSVLILAVSAVAALKAVEILLDMHWTRSRGQAFAQEAREKLSVGDHVDIAALESRHGRPQPIYSWLNTRLAEDPDRRWPQVFRRAYRIPEIVTGLAASAALAPLTAAPVRYVAAIAAWALVTTTLLNAPLRRLALGSMDGINRDIMTHAQREGLATQKLVATQIGRNLSRYFLWLAYVAVVGYAAVYWLVALCDEGAFHVALDHPDYLTWLYYSAVTISTIGYGDIYPQGHLAQLLVLAQIGTGPLLLSWLIAVFLGDRD